ncbi:MAG TPA: hypothetical protein PK264_13650, partial [Hyphomicrobiaceae bacterium]|nr:hypothetical protein [Hyphomicrobiaceae bacterium]
MSYLIALRRYLRIPISLAHAIVARFGHLGYVVLATLLPIGLMILAYSSMFDDFSGAKPRPGDTWRILLLIVPTALAIVLAIALPFIDELGRIEDADRAKARRGEVWAHWRLPSDAWA